MPRHHSLSLKTMPNQTDTQINNQAPDQSAANSVGLKKAPVEDKQAIWAKIETVYNAAKTAYLTKGSSLSDVIDSLISTLMDIETNETQSLGGLGQNTPQMEGLPNQ